MTAPMIARVIAFVVSLGLFVGLREVMVACRPQAAIRDCSPPGKPGLAAHALD